MPPRKRIPKKGTPGYQVYWAQRRIVEDLVPSTAGATAYAADAYTALGMTDSANLARLAGIKIEEALDLLKQAHANDYPLGE